jgi:hypothetical protein
MQSEERQADERNVLDARVFRARRDASMIDQYVGRARTAPRGAESTIGDDETHRRLQEARNRARHSTEDLIRRELGPEWV